MKYITILLILISFSGKAQDSIKLDTAINTKILLLTEYNILIGEAVTEHSYGSYNIIISDASEITTCGDFIWLIEYDCKFLADKPELVKLLRAIEPLMLANKDTVASIRIHELIKPYLIK